MLQETIHAILHLNDTLASIVQSMGVWTYIIIFLVIFAETGLVVTPFLPGDSLLLAAGALAAISQLNIWVLMISLTTAGILGNTCNYFIGRWFGPKVFHFPKSRFFNPAYLQKAHVFYQKYGAVAIVTSRFLPIIRTFAPFVAGIAKMDLKRFSMYNAIGCTLWAIPFLSAGYFFGNIPFIKNHFSLIILIIVLISITPAIFAFIQSHQHQKKTKKQ